MSKKVEKCPMCNLPKEESCDLMTVKDKKGASVCCCENATKKSVKKA